MGWCLYEVCVVVLVYVKLGVIRWDMKYVFECDYVGIDFDYVDVCEW